MIKQRPYQTKGIKQIWEAWDSNDPEQDILMYVACTGSGKTEIFIEVQREILRRKSRSMIIAHRQELIMQAWQRLYNSEIYAGIIMSKISEKYELPTQVCSIQTIARRKNLPPVEYIIIDEGHHVTNENSYGEILRKYPNAKVLIVTATPYRLSGEGFERLHPWKPTKLILNISLAEAQAEGWLVPIRYFACHVPDLSQVHLARGEYVEEEVASIMGLAPLVESYQEHAAGMCGVFFTINIRHSINTVQQFLHAGIPAAHLDANTPDEERVKILSDFKARKILVISNVGIITEGFDFPDLEFVGLAVPTKSLSKFLQAVGRVTRSNAGVDRFATIVERICAIMQSTKPSGIVLDCAGCWTDHRLPDFPHDWPYYFKGARKQKKREDEMMEMLVYVAEDENGKRITTRKIKEVEGMKLIEITKEIKKKLINITSIRHLDEVFAKFKRSDKIKRPGYVAFTEFIKFCNRGQILMVDEIWDYIERKLIAEIDFKLEKMAASRALNPGAYPYELYVKSVQKLNAEKISKAFLRTEKEKYFTANEKELADYRMFAKPNTLFS